MNTKPDTDGDKCILVLLQADQGRTLNIIL